MGIFILWADVTHILEMNGFEGSRIDIKTINDVFDNTYFKINKVLLELTGIWPYQKIFDARLKQFIVIFILSIFSYPHVRIKMSCNGFYNKQINE